MREAAPGGIAQPRGTAHLMLVALVAPLPCKHRICSVRGAATAALGLAEGRPGQRRSCCCCCCRGHREASMVV